MITPLFDSLAHPTLTGQWLSSGRDATFESLDRSLRGAHFLGAVATGISGVEGYEHRGFVRHCSKYPNLLPVAGIHPSDPDKMRAELAEVLRMGYVGIKIHPRFSRLNASDRMIAEVFQAAADVGMPVYYCTYLHAPIDRYPTQEPFYDLVAALQSAPKAKVVLLHGGDVRLMQYAELVRFNPNLLLDLSMTICKYADSSLDHDIRFLFKSFDRRICIGSDHPEWPHSMLRQRFDHFAAGLELEKSSNIGHGNILRFFDRLDLAI